MFVGVEALLSAVAVGTAVSVVGSAERKRALLALCWLGGAKLATEEELSRQRRELSFIVFVCLLRWCYVVSSRRRRRRSDRWVASSRLVVFCVPLTLQARLIVC